jgi:hypothetical protein
VFLSKHVFSTVTQPYQQYGCKDLAQGQIRLNAEQLNKNWYLLNVIYSRIGGDWSMLSIELGIRQCQLHNIAMLTGSVCAR